jgi:hypothetical protein
MAEAACKRYLAASGSERDELPNRESLLRLPCPFSYFNVHLKHIPSLSYISPRDAGAPCSQVRIALACCQQLAISLGLSPSLLIVIDFHIMLASARNGTRYEDRPTRARLAGDKISETLTPVLREMVNEIKNSDDIIY